MVVDRDQPRKLFRIVRIDEDPVIAPCFLQLPVVLFEQREHFFEIDSFQLSFIAKLLRKTSLP